MENHKDGSGLDSCYPRHDVQGETCASPCGNAARVANNGSHIYWFDADLIDVRRTAMVRGLNTYGVNSDVNVFAGNAGDVFDVIGRQLNRPDVNAFAWGQCATGASYGGSDALHTRWCSTQWVIWNTWTAAASKVNTFARYNYIGCHEVGHTLGLRHRSTSPTTCMIGATSGPSDPNSVVPSVTDPTVEEMQHLNAHY